MASDMGIHLEILFFTFPFKRKDVFLNYWNVIFSLFLTRAVSMVTLLLSVMPSVVIKVQPCLIKVVVFIDVLLVKIISQLKGLLKMKWSFILY